MVWNHSKRRDQLVIAGYDVENVKTLCALMSTLMTVGGVGQDGNRHYLSQFTGGQECYNKFLSDMTEQHMMVAISAIRSADGQLPAVLPDGVGGLINLPGVAMVASGTECGTSEAEGKPWIAKQTSRV